MRLVTGWWPAPYLIQLALQVWQSLGLQVLDLTLRQSCPLSSFLLAGWVVPLP